jgi:hypothetical protein
MRIRKPVHFPKPSMKFTPFISMLVVIGCGPVDPYGPYIVDPIKTTSHATESWAFVESGSMPETGAMSEGWEATLLTDILQLGAWPPHDEPGTRALDSAWNGFSSFEGTRIAIEGIDSALAQSGQLEDARQRLHGAFGRWTQHFPDAPIPNLDFAYTGFNYSVYPTSELLMVGCEFFIGADHPAVRGLPPHIYPRYVQERMVPEHLVGDALRGWLLVHFQDDHYPKQGRLADELVYWGKVLFIARCLAPGVEPWDLLDFTPEEWAWIQAHEMQVWIELRKEEFLYTTHRMDIQRWTADAPFTKAGAVPQDSPDRLGWYMGLRWVEDFMRRHPEMSLAELMAQQDVLPFLQSYRPGS